MEPLRSMRLAPRKAIALTTFHDLGLSKNVLSALEALGFDKPTPIQEKAIPMVLAGNDLIGLAQTGTGKTAAFGLPMIERLLAEDRRPDPRNIRALVLAPTRELVNQIADNLRDFVKKTHLRVVTVVGGASIHKQSQMLERGTDILVATPGRLLDLVSRKSVTLTQGRYLVLDEADQMLDKGFGPDVERIIRSTPASRQTALFSATTPGWVKDVSARYLMEPKTVSVTTEDEAPPDIDHSIIEVWSGDKISTLIKLLELPEEGATLVFGRTRHGVINLARRLNKMGFEVEALQGDLSQPARDRIVARFRSGKVPILLATNVAARGLDMLNITRVINYDVPETSELFVHRVGRTGRMGRSGQAITLLAATELQKMHEIERALGTKLPRVTVEQIAAAALTLPVAERMPAETPAIEVVEAPAEVKAEEPAKRRRRRRRPAGAKAEATAAS
jgi:ATP-dependent RNA helicase RhlE